MLSQGTVPAPTLEARDERTEFGTRDADLVPPSFGHIEFSAHAGP